LRTVYISHRLCHAHDTGEDHPENACRLSAIEDRLISTGLFDVLRQLDAPEATRTELLRVHTPAYLETLETMMPDSGFKRLDQDTVICPVSLEAALRAAGAVVLGVDLVMGGDTDTAFCCVRPPGHHAESGRAMGFCLLNNLAVGAAHALEAHGVKRVAIVDFDVHQGNGTEEIFAADDRVLFCSAFQHPYFPFTPLMANAANRVNVPLEAGAKSAEFRAAVSDHWIPALERFRPELLFFSAGFDAHRDDDMSHVSLTDADFLWMAKQVLQAARGRGSVPVISALEGGYDLDSLARCVDTHLRVLMDLQ
jgi:acetoin utilization deacetylase AcuC-like enzyme